MDTEIRGIIQWRDNGLKRVTVIVSTDVPRLQDTIGLDDDIPVNRGTITAALRHKLGPDVNDILIPRHIRVEDIEDKEKK